MATSDDNTLSIKMAIEEKHSELVEVWEENDNPMQPVWVWLPERLSTLDDKIGYSNFIPGKPSNTNKHQRVVFSYENNGMWFNDVFSTKYPYVCQFLGKLNHHHCHKYFLVFTRITFKNDYTLLLYKLLRLNKTRFYGWSSHLFTIY